MWNALPNRVYARALMIVGVVILVLLASHTFKLLIIGVNKKLLTQHISGPVTNHELF